MLAQDPALDASPPPPPPPTPRSSPLEARPASKWIDRHRALALVGREELLARLWAGWHRVVETSSGGVALVDGDPGIGKTRLAAELAHGVLGRGGRVIAARCVRGAGLAALVPSIDQLGIPVETAPLVPGSPALVEVAHRVAHEVRFGPTASPTLLVLEDAQWLDEQMVAVFGDLGDRPLPPVDANPNLVLLLTQRGWPPPPGSARMVDGIDRLAWQDHLRLEVLGDDEARALVAEAHRAAGRTPPLPATTIDEIVVAGGGNPRVLVELTGGPVPLPGPDAAPAFTERLRRSLGERLARLPAEVLDVVLTAAVIGDEVDLDTVHRAAGLEADRTLAALEAAVAARLLDEVPERPGHFRFLNRVDRRLVLERVSLARRGLVEGRLAAG